MKKILFISTVCLLVNFMAQAQKTRVGVTAGAAISNLHAKFEGESDNGKSIVGFTAGVLADIPLGESFSFQPALNWVQKGTKEEETFNGITEKTKLTGNHLEIPLHFLYNAPGNTGTFFIGAGPSVALALSGKMKYDDGDNSISIDLKYGNNPDEDDMKGVDFGISMLTGYRFPNGLFISANYNLGLSNLVTGGSEEGKLKSSYFGIRLGWLFNGNGTKNE